MSEMENQGGTPSPFVHVPDEVVDEVFNHAYVQPLVSSWEIKYLIGQMLTECARMRHRGMSKEQARVLIEASAGQTVESRVSSETTSAQLHRAALYALDVAYRGEGLTVVPASAARKGSRAR
jgi:hypothetical protein